MRRLVALAGCAVALGALLWRARVQAGELQEAARAGGVEWSHLALAPDAAWRLRLVELTLASGRAPVLDRGLDAPAGRAVPWSAGFEIASAGWAQWFHARPPDAGGPPDTGGVPESALFDLALGAPLVAGLASLALLALGTWPRTRGRDLAPFLAVLVAHAWFGPSIRPGAFAAAPFAAAFALAFVLALERVLRARQPSEWAFAALGTGALGGLGIGCDLALTALVAAGAGATAVRAALADEERSRDLTRAGLLSVGATLAFLVLFESARSPLASGAPSPDGAAAFPLQRFALALLLFPLFGRIVAGARLPRPLLAGAVVLVPLAVAGADPHLRGAFTPDLVQAGRPAAVAIVAALALLGAARAARPGGSLPHAIGAAFGVLAFVVCVQADPAPTRAELDRRADAIRLARALRDRSASPGPWNDPLARPDWVALTPPEVDRVVLLFARRPVRAGTAAPDRAELAGVRWAIAPRELDAGAPPGFTPVAEARELALSRRTAPERPPTSAVPRDR